MQAIIPRLPAEIAMAIAEAVRGGYRPSPAEAARAGARGLAALRRVSRGFNGMVNDMMRLDPAVAMVASRAAIAAIAKAEPADFKNQLDKLIRDSWHVEVPIRVLSPGHRVIALEALSAAGATSELRILNFDFRGADFSADELASALAIGGASQHLKIFLDVSGNPYGDGCVVGIALAKVLAGALRGPDCKVTRLELRGKLIGAAGAKVLAGALSHSRLEHLDLTSNGIEQKGAEALAAVLADSKLSVLGLGRNRLGAGGAAALAAVLPRSRLAELDVSINVLGDKGTEAFADAMQSALNRLRRLVLRKNGIGVVGAGAIARALQDPHCKACQIDLAGNDIAPGLAILAPHLERVLLF